MGHDHSSFFKRFTFIFISLLVLVMVSCQKPEEKMVSLIKNHYANLYVNNESHKRSVLKKLNQFFKDHKLEEKNEEEISLILNELNDGHVFLKNNQHLNVDKTSDLKFFPGSFFVKECKSSCRPSLKEGKYEIVEIDQIPWEKWLKDNAFKVAASSNRGRTFRTSRLLVRNNKRVIFKLKLKDSKAKISEVELKVDESPNLQESCVEGKRLNEKTFYLKIKTLWCDKNNNEIVKNYRHDWDQAVLEIKQTDKVIIDLRENNGGDDNEVIYTLNAFIKNPFILYKYRYLTLNQPGKFNRLLHLIPLSFDLWGPVGYDQSTLYPKVALQKTFYENQVSVLISSGCFSSCEGLAAAFKNEKRAKLIGNTTHGGAGDPLFFPISNSPYSINLTTCLTWQSNGELFEGIGVTPDQKKDDLLADPGDSILTWATQDN